MKALVFKKVLYIFFILAFMQDLNTTLAQSSPVSRITFQLTSDMYQWVSIPDAGRIADIWISGKLVTYSYDAASTATDNGTTVIKPNIISGAGRWLIYSTTDAAAEIGTWKFHGGPTVPYGYLFCDGSAISRTTYANLFAVIGTTYGAGDGSTTFNIPDGRQRFPLGKAASGTGSTLGATGGNIDHVHSVDPPNTTTTTPSSTIAATNLLTSAANPNHTHDVNIPAFNSASANPPFIVCNYIIKYQ